VHAGNSRAKQFIYQLHLATIVLMVNDFLPRRQPARASASSPVGRAPQQNTQRTPVPTADKPSAAPLPFTGRPQLTGAQPFLRAGQLSRRETFSQEQASRLETDSPDIPTPDNKAGAGQGDTPKPPKKSLGERFKGWWHGLGKWQKIAVITGLVLVLLGGAAAAYFLTKKEAVAPVKPAAKQQTVTPPAPQPVKVISKLTGMEVDPGIADRPVTGVMIENSPDARPQAGLNDAGVIFEAIAEGGITRFLALFQDKAPDYIGPVRSIRPYYIQWALGFDASIAHVGGSGEALQNMKDWHARDLDQFAGGNYFWRVSHRYAPHNVYTSLAKLNEYEQKKGYGKSNFTGFARKDKEVKPTATPTARIIDLDISGFYYNVHYDYIAATNSYARKVGGEAHLDEKSKQQLSPKVVVALVMPYSLQANRIHSVYNTLGSGKTYIFQDGAVTEGTWHKESRDKNFTFTDSGGKEVKLNPGQTWLTAVGANSDVAYAP
jgi:hypothetical protein